MPRTKPAVSVPDYEVIRPDQQLKKHLHLEKSRFHLGFPELTFMYETFEGDSSCLSLYLYYLVQVSLNLKNNMTIPIHQICEETGMGINRAKKTRKKLIDMRLIELIPYSAKTKKSKKPYIIWYTIVHMPEGRIKRGWKSIEDLPHYHTLKSFPTVWNPYGWKPYGCNPSGNYTPYNKKNLSPDVPGGTHQGSDFGGGDSSSLEVSEPPKASAKHSTPPKTKPSTPPKTKHQQRHSNLSMRVVRLQRKNWPNYAKVFDGIDPESGARTLDQLERLDDFQWEDIKNALLWAVDDEFWSRNVWSCAGLREKGKDGTHKFAKILAAYESSNGNGRAPDDPHPELTRQVYEYMDQEPNPTSTKKIIDNLRTIRDFYRAIPPKIKKDEMWPIRVRRDGWDGMVLCFLDWMKEDSFARDKIQPGYFRADGHFFQSYYKSITP